MCDLGGDLADCPAVWRRPAHVMRMIMPSKASSSFVGFFATFRPSGSPHLTSRCDVDPPRGRLVLPSSKSRPVWKESVR